MRFVRVSAFWMLSLACLCTLRLGVSAFGQDAEINLKGAFDTHVHQGPDSMPRVIDADDVARLASQRGMRGMIMKSHFEDTAGLVYLVRKEVPGFEAYGGIAQNLAVGGINLESVKHMDAMKGGFGKVVWLPTFDSENAVKKAGRNAPYVSVSKDGQLLPSVLELLVWLAQHPELVLETGHISADEVIMVSHEAHKRGVAHVVVTHAMASPIQMTIPQMQEVVKDGTYIEFVYGATKEAHPVVSVADYVKAMQAIGVKWCVLGTDYGSVVKPPRQNARWSRMGCLNL